MSNEINNEIKPDVVEDIALGNACWVIPLFGAVMMFLMASIAIIVA